jgi:UDP-glucuronate decarboxylase
VDTRVIRIFNTYGPRMAKFDGRVVSNFIVQALSNEPITIYGDGSQSRSFCYVDDLVKGIYQMLMLESSPGVPINLGNPHEFTMLELANKVLEITQSKSVLDFKPLPEDDPKQRRPDISRANEFLHWTPDINLHEGIEKTSQYFSELLGHV